MEYALIKEGIVIDIIVLNKSNAYEFPSVVFIDGLRIVIGDTYIDGKFYHDGVEVVSSDEDDPNLIIDILTGEVE